MYIDSLSLTWYLVGAESKILKQYKLQEVRHIPYSALESNMLDKFRRRNGEMSACFANVTNITAYTRKFVHDARTEPVRERIFHVEQVLNFKFLIFRVCNANG